MYFALVTSLTDFSLVLEADLDAEGEVSTHVIIETQRRIEQAWNT